jgi:hypothetical protein
VARSVLIPGGLFVLITYGGPDFRLPYLEEPACDWDVLVYVLTRHEGGRGRTPAGSPKSCGGWQARRPRRRRAQCGGPAAALSAGARQQGRSSVVWVPRVALVSELPSLQCRLALRAVRRRAAARAPCSRRLG